MLTCQMLLVLSQLKWQNKEQGGKKKELCAGLFNRSKQLPGNHRMLQVQQLVIFIGANGETFVTLHWDPVT